jgi:peptidyl-prolyl cis-trans isomerase A (cyclophilin A)
MMRPFFLLLICCCLSVAGTAQLRDMILLKEAPKTFRAIFRTTKGEFEIEVHRDWSPLAADRLYQLLLDGYYNNNIIFRMQTGYVTQFGIPAEKELYHFWYPKKIADEPVIQKNEKATIGFAREGKNSRATHLYINLADNPKLDTIIRGGVKGYPPFARVTRGMDVVLAFYAGYGKWPAAVQDSLYVHGNRYFEKKFPWLDRIISAEILR